jgi:isocitrate dehydrogenase
MKNITFEHLTIPEDGKAMWLEDTKLCVPDKPIIPYIVGDGIGKDVWPVTKKVLENAIEKTYQGKKQIVWCQLPAGEMAFEQYGQYLPVDTLKAIEYFKVALKGPLTTPVGGGIRSLNVTIRQKLDLYACVRPVRYFKGIPAVVRNPELLNVVIYRENTEDLYKGIEFKCASSEADNIIDYLNQNFNASIRKDSGIGIKPISEYGSKRIIERAIKYALSNNKKTITLVHKGNIMKFTEGAFRNWGYELVNEKYKDVVITVQELQEQYHGQQPVDKILMNDVITDAMFQELLLKPEKYEVIVSTNLNGDYLSDAAAAQVGGLGIAPGANLSDTIGVFEATHGTAPDIAGKDIANPSSMILSAVMLLEHIGWKEAANLITQALEKTLENKKVTCDIKMEGATILKCSEFGDAIINNF